MNKNDRIAIVNLHHALGKCRKDAWVGAASYLKDQRLSLTLREVATLQSVYRHELAADAELTLADLARRIQLKNAITSQTVSNLVGKGLMIREDNAENRRKVTISLSRRGAEIAEGIAALADAYIEKYLAPLTDAERTALFKMAEKLNPGSPY